MLVGITAPNKIQEMTAVVSGGMEGIAHGSLRADGNHRVPNVDAHSDGDFKFNLGNFENEWNDNNSLLVFRYFNDFDRPLCAGGRFFIQALLPSAEHPTDLIEPENESAVAFVANHFLFPRELQEKTEQIGRGDSSRYEGEFFKRIISETGLKKRLEKTQENIVNPRADRVAVDALQVYYAFMPQAVTLLRFYENQRSISLGGVKFDVCSRIPTTLPSRWKIYCSPGNDFCVGREGRRTSSLFNCVSRKNSKTSTPLSRTGRMCTADIQLSIFPTPSRAISTKQVCATA